VVLVPSSFEEGDGDGTANRATCFEDLRARVLGAVDRGGRVYEVAELFEVSVSYIYKALARRRLTGVARHCRSVVVLVASSIGTLKRWPLMPPWSSWSNGLRPNVA
jgi:hypothetical protein